MEFVVSRASIWATEEKPTEKAYKKVVTMKEERTVPTPEIFNKLHSHREGLWESIGRNHFINDSGYIEREIDTEEWVINFKDLEELSDFIKKEGDVIIFNKNSFDYSLDFIVIYDSAMEW